MPEIRVSKREMCSSALWHKFCVIFSTAHYHTEGFEAASLKMRLFYFSFNISLFGVPSNSFLFLKFKV